MTDGTFPEFIKNDPPLDLDGYLEPHYIIEDPRPSLSAGLKMPIITVSGEHDRAKYPVCMAMDAAEQIAGINVYADLNDAEHVSIKSARAMMDHPDSSREEKKLGLSLGSGNIRSFTAEGTVFDVGDIPSRDGIVPMRVVCEENMGHWPTPGLGGIFFDFFSHFSRDRETGESIYTEQGFMNE